MTMLLDPVTDLEAKLQRRLGARVQELRLTRHDGGLVLHGVARTYYAKQLAQHAAMEVTGLPIAANEIEVFGPPAFASVTTEP